MWHFVVRQKKFFSLILFSLFPLTMLWIAAHFNLPRASLLIYPDPDGYYLTNSLRVAAGMGGHFSDHPGIPLYSFGGLVVKLKHILFSEGQADLIRDVLANPHRYFSPIAYSLILINAISLVSLCFYYFKRGASHLSLLIFQLLFFLSPFPLLVLGRFAPEAVFISISCLLGWCLTEESAKKYWAPATGLAVSVKLHWLSWATGFFFMGNNKKRLNSVFIALLVFFSFYLLLSRERILPSFVWMGEMFGQRDVYVQSSGYWGFLPWETIRAKFQEIFSVEQNFLPIFYCLVLIALFVAIHSKITGKLTEQAKLFFLFPSIFILGVLVISKKPTQVYYLLPVILLAPHAFIHFYLYTKKLRPLVLIFGLFFVYRAYLVNYPIFTNHIETVVKPQLAQEVELADIRKKNPTCLLLTWEYAPAIEVALDMGNIATDRAFTNQLFDLYPNYLASLPQLSAIRSFRSHIFFDPSYYKKKYCFIYVFMRGWEVGSPPNLSFILAQKNQVMSGRFSAFLYNPPL